jgi:catalase
MRLAVEAFEPGTKTETRIRLSTVAGERGSPDTRCEPSGFSLSDYQLSELGKLMLNRNFTDHHTEIEQRQFPDTRRAHPELGSQPRQTPASGEAWMGVSSDDTGSMADDSGISQDLE